MPLRALGGEDSGCVFPQSDFCRKLPLAGQLGLVLRKLLNIMSQAVIKRFLLVITSGRGMQSVNFP